MAAGGFAMATPLEAFLARFAHDGIEGVRPPDAPGYGPLAPVKDRTTGLPLLWLPEGFSYLTFGWTGDPMNDGRRTPHMHDGMAAFPAGRTRVRLVRNHESSLDTGAFARADAYDEAAGGGTTTIEFDTGEGRAVRAWASISGTLRNCGGGPTPWGSWLTCEETLLEPSSKTKLEKRHGYIFEVPSGMTEPVRAIPLVDMGRFVHEAVAVDPATGIVYETEDFGTAGFYRFLPRRPGQLQAGGTLQMLAIEGRPRLDTRTNQEPNATYRVSWVDIKEPDRAHADTRLMDSLGVFTQGLEQGGAIFARLEGICHGEGRLYFTATSGGNALAGQVWELDPAGATLRLVFESPSQVVLDMPDNVCVSPRGGLVLCEDGRAEQFVRGLTRDGRIFDFARNNAVLAGEKNGFQGDFSRSEFAGATFGPDGRWLFFNIQTPGITVALTGPWDRGGL